jgi:hypothetical protein
MEQRKEVKFQLAKLLIEMYGDDAPEVALELMRLSCLPESMRVVDDDGNELESCIVR